MPAWQEALKKYNKLLWQGTLAFFSVLCIGMLVAIWLSGKWEAREAFDSGRRLLIAIDTGEVKGKIITLDVQGVAKPAEPAAPPVDEPKPAEAAAPAPETIGNEPPSATETTAEETAKETESAAPVTPMPDVNPSLVEHTTAGNLPIIGSDGTKPWRAYSKPFQRQRNMPMVAIIFTGLGTSRTVTQDVLHLSEHITVSFSPYTRDLSIWNAAARATGHEMLIDMAMEPTNFPLMDPGPDALFASRGPEENEKHVQTMLARFPTAMGFLTPQNEGYSASDDAFKALLQSLANRGLMMIIGGEPKKKETKDLLDASHIASAIGNVWIDEEPSQTAIRARLEQLEDQAAKHGYAVGIAQPYPVTVKEIRAWTKLLNDRGVILVPVSAIIKLRFS